MACTFKFCTVTRFSCAEISLFMIHYEFEKRVTETCARDPTPQGKRIVADYSHYRSVQGESKYYFLIERPLNLENKIGRRVGLISSTAVEPYSGVNVTLISSRKRVC